MVEPVTTTTTAAAPHILEAGKGLLGSLWDLITKPFKTVGSMIGGAFSHVFSLGTVAAAGVYAGLVHFAPNLLDYLNLKPLGKDLNKITVDAEHKDGLWGLGKVAFVVGALFQALWGAAKGGLNEIAASSEESNLPSKALSFGISGAVVAIGAVSAAKLLTGHGIDFSSHDDASSKSPAPTPNKPANQAVTPKK